MKAALRRKLKRAALLLPALLLCFCLCATAALAASTPAAEPAATDAAEQTAQAAASEESAAQPDGENSNKAGLAAGTLLLIGSGTARGKAQAGIRVLRKSHPPSLICKLDIARGTTQNGLK